MIKFTDSETEQLFLRYAVPCGCVLVQRGNITQNFLDELEDKVTKKEKIEKDLQEIWPFATGNLLVLAKKQGKEKIDKEILHTYFWDMHAAVVLDRNADFGDLNVKRCLVLPAKIIAINSTELTVKTLFGERKVKSEFLDEFKVNDLITIHYDNAIEKISEKNYSKLKHILMTYDNIPL